LDVGAPTGGNLATDGFYWVCGTQMGENGMLASDSSVLSISTGLQGGAIHGTAVGFTSSSRRSMVVTDGTNLLQLVLQFVNVPGMLSCDRVIV
jgi:hypothetical protein